MSLENEKDRRLDSSKARATAMKKATRSESQMVSLMARCWAPSTVLLLVDDSVNVTEFRSGMMMDPYLAHYLDSRLA